MRFIPGLALVALVLACGSPVADVDGACFEVPQALLSANGRELQGVGLNGIEVQGIGLNGIELQGIGLNGTRMQGVGVNGITRNGIWENGLQTQGIGINGLQINGVWSNGIGVNGIWSNGITRNGIGINGEKVSAMELGVLDVRIDGGLLVVTNNGEALADDDVVGLFLYATSGDDVLALKIESI